MNFIPTPLQRRVFKEIRETDNSIIINSVAGSGKTTTIVESLKIIPRNRNAIFLAYNKSIAEELRTRVPAYIDVSTIHSFGARAMFRHFGCSFNENKSFTYCLKLFKQWNAEAEIKEPKYNYCYYISRLVDLMRLTLTTEAEAIEQLSIEYGIFLEELEIKRAKQLFNICYKDTKRIDFVDQIFQPAVRDIKLPRYDFVFVDEVQDLCSAQQAIVKKIIMPGRGRLIAVGDPRQAIYGFAGADHNSYECMKTLVPNTVELPLSMSFRCPKKIIERAKTIVSYIECSETQIEGIDREDGKLEEIQAGDWVLCRNLYPLVLLFRYLIKQGKKANIRGREIGKNIINLIEKTKKQDVATCLKMIEIYIIQTKTKLLKKGFARPNEHPKMINLVEKREIIKILGAGVSSTQELKKRIEAIFLDDAKGIVLSSIHKSKGLENDRIFIICPELMPSKYATTEKELTQEQNLKYVAYTRAKRELIFINKTVDDLKEMLED